MVRMRKHSHHPRPNHLHITSHARQRLAERGLGPALGAIAMVAYSTSVCRTSVAGRFGRREEIFVDGVTIVVSVPDERGIRSLITVFSDYDENGAQVCQRLCHFLKHRTIRKGGSTHS